MNLSRALALLPIAAVLLVRAFFPERTSGLAMVALSGALLGLSWVIGRAVVVWVSLKLPRGSGDAVATVVGFSVCLLLSHVLVMIGVRPMIQSGLLGLLVVGAAWTGLRETPAAPRDSRNDAVDVLGVAFAGVLFQALPMLRHDAWSVAGHDADGLINPDGATHTMLAFLAQRGVGRALHYPLGIHSYVGGTANLFLLDPFRMLAATIPALGGLLALATHSLARAWGLTRWSRLLAASLVATHPLLLFVGMEQYVPQLAACALGTASLAIVSHPAAESSVWRASSRGRQLLSAIPLAALLATYGLAFLILLPLVCACAVFHGRIKTGSLCLVLALSFALAPFGVVALGRRAAHLRDHPADATPDLSGGILFPADPNTMPTSERAPEIYSWRVTASHELGTTPYRDQFDRTADALSASPLRGLVLRWRHFGVPVATSLLALLLVAAVVRRSRRGGPLAILAMWVVVAAFARVGVFWGYHAFKVHSLLCPAAMVVLVRGLGTLPPIAALRSSAAFVIIAGRIPSFAAVEVDYGRELAVGRDFAASVTTLLQETHHRRVALIDPSFTRRLWFERFILGEAKIVPLETMAEFVLCEVPSCPASPPLFSHGRLRLVPVATAAPTGSDELR